MLLKVEFENNTYIWVKFWVSVKISTTRSSHPKVLQEGVLWICSKITREHPCWNVILTKLHKSLFNSCPPVYLLHLFRAPFCKSSSREGFFHTKYYSTAPIFTKFLRYTNADVKTSLYVRVHIKIISWKFRILNQNFTGE